MELIERRGPGRTVRVSGMGIGEVVEANEADSW